MDPETRASLISRLEDSPSEAAWLAVQKNFPASDSNTNQYYSLLADVQLAELYLQERNEEMALERYRKLFEFCELFPGLFPEFYPVSLVGQAVALERIDKVKNEAEVSDLVFLFNEWVISTNADEGPREPTLVSQGLFSSFRSAIERYGWNDRYEAQDMGWETL